MNDLAPCSLTQIWHDKTLQELSDIACGRVDRLVVMPHEHRIKLLVGDRIELCAGLICQVTAIREYQNFEVMLESEDCRRIEPRFSAPELLHFFRANYTLAEETSGFMVAQIRVL